MEKQGNLVRFSKLGWKIIFGQISNLRLEKRLSNLFSVSIDITPLPLSVFCNCCFFLCFLFDLVLFYSSIISLQLPLHGCCCPHCFSINQVVVVVVVAFHLVFCVFFFFFSNFPLTAPVVHGCCCPPCFSIDKVTFLQPLAATSPSPVPFDFFQTHFDSVESRRR